MRLSLEGIGATLSTQDGYTVVENLIPGGAAAKSGEIEPKDKIIAVAHDEQIRNQLSLVWGVEPAVVRPTISFNLFFATTQKIFKFVFKN